MGFLLFLGHGRVPLGQRRLDPGVSLLVLIPSLRVGPGMDVRHHEAHALTEQGRG
jgi:hypothetical protein